MAATGVTGGFGADLKHSIRSFLKRPGIVVAALVNLAVGIGVGTAIFSIVNAILLQPLPYKDPDSLVMVWNLNEREGYTYDKTRSRGDSMAPAEFAEWREAGIFEEMTMFFAQLMTVTGSDNPEMTHGYALSEGGFEMLGVEPLLGRFPSTDEFTPGGGHVIVLRHNLWQRRYNGDPNVLGETIEFYGRPYRIIGVMPPDFVFFNRQSEFLSTLAFSENFLQNRTFRDFRVMARLKPGMSLEDAQARATQFSAEMERKYPDTNTGWHVELVTIADDSAGELHAALTVLLAAVGCVLLIMCANVANLLLVRASGRGRELAVRVALGAGRWRLIRQLLSESLMLSLLGGALGLGLAWVLVRYFQAMAPDRYTHGKYLLQLEALRVDPTVALFALGVAAAAGALFGLLPALRASRPDLNEGLKDSGRGSAGGFKSSGVRAALVVGEVAIGLVLLVASSLLVRSFMALYDRGPGLEAANLLTLITPMPTQDIVQQLRDEGVEREELNARLATAVRSMNNEMLARLEAVPGVERAAATSTLPMQGWFQPRELTIDGRAHESSLNAPRALTSTTTTNYFETMDVPLQKGRGFEATDGPDSALVCVISDELAARYWPNEDPIGRRVKLGAPDSRAPWMRIVGVVGSIRESGMDTPGTPALYTPLTQSRLNRPWIVLQTAGDPMAVVPDVRRVIKDFNAAIPIYRVRAMSDIVRDSAWRINYSMTLLTGLAGLSLLLAVVGLYGVISYSVRERTQEIGVRMALGADKPSVLKMVLADGAKLVGAGLAIGAALAAVSARFLDALLFGVEPLDLSSFALAGAALLGAGLLACYAPARRATAVHPIEALRHE